MPPAPAYPPADIAAAIARALRNAGDTPQPYVDYLRSPLKYAAIAQDFRSSAWRHLDAGDLPQASNKAWELVAETVKAVSAQHGGVIHKYQSISAVLYELIRLLRTAGDADSARLLSLTIMTANQMYANFYVNELHKDFVLVGLMQCEEMSDRLFALFWPAGAAASAGLAAA